MKKAPSHQLSLFDEPVPSMAVDPVQNEMPVVVNLLPAPIGWEPSSSDLEAMRAWLLAWGKAHDYPGFSFPLKYPEGYSDTPGADKRFGRMRDGHDGWYASVHPPYKQTEHYPGEWLAACVEHVKRFEAGVQRIPPQEFKQKTPTTAAWDNDI